MAGHSKWANIKHRKARQDAKRGKAFTKIIRELVVAAQQGGPYPADNPRLRAVVDKALVANMKRDTIDKAIARGAGTAEGENYEELTYEGYGCGGVAVLVECMTDNRNRTVSDVRHAFSKRGGNLGTDGSVAYLFTKLGQIIFAPGVSEETLMDAALEAGADDVITHEDGSIEVITSPDAFMDVKDALVALGEIANAEITMLPSTTAALDESAADQFLKMIDMLEELDDVQNVYHNAEISDDIMEKLQG